MIPLSTVHHIQLYSDKLLEANLLCDPLEDLGLCLMRLEYQIRSHDGSEI